MEIRVNSVSLVIGELRSLYSGYKFFVWVVMIGNGFWVLSSILSVGYREKRMEGLDK